MSLGIIKSAQAENGAQVGYHYIVKCELTAEGDGLIVLLGSWPNKSSFLQRYEPSGYHNYKIMLSDLGNSSGLLSDIISVITSNGWLVGGAQENLGSEPELEKAKQMRWLTIKLARDRQEFGGFVWDGSTFDSDPQSQSRIQGGVQLASIAQQASQPFSITWTLQNNTTRVLNAQDMISVALALANHVQTIHSTGRTVRQQLENANTLEEVNSIIWPA